MDNLDSGMPAQLSENRTTFPPPIVRDWFVRAINPLIYGLRMEVRLLSRGDLSWRYAQAAIVSFVPVRDRLSQNGRDLWDQFFSQFSEFGDLADRHDQAAHDLELSCALLSQALVESFVLRDIFAESVRADALTEEQVQQTFGAALSDHYLHLLAEYLVNSLGSLPDYYTTARFWNLHQLRFRESLVDPAIAPKWADVQVKRNLLQAQTEMLLNKLVQKRLELSLDAGVSFGDESWPQFRLSVAGYRAISEVVRRTLSGPGEYAPTEAR